MHGVALKSFAVDAMVEQNVFHMSVVVPHFLYRNIIEVRFELGKCISAISIIINE